MVCLENAVEFINVKDDCESSVTVDDDINIINNRQHTTRNQRKRRKYNIDIAKEEFAKRNLTLLEDEYKSSAILMKCICNNHPDIIQYKSLNSLLFCRGGCHLCRNERKGADHNIWKGGISSINTYLREYLKEWKKESMMSCGYKCVISGGKFNVVHHLYSYNKILSETLQETNLPIYTDVGSYSEDEITILKEKCIEIHNRYPLGVCLSKDVHNLYHHLYGDDNTPEQFEEFRVRYNLGEFKDVG